MTETSPHAAPVRQALQALQAQGLHPAAESLPRLLDYLALLARWNRVYNLTAVREPAAMVVQHLLDCAAIWPPLRRHLGQPAASTPVLDVGSGAGLPGAVLAILDPLLEITCVDAVAKKAGFVRQVAAELGLPNLHAMHARAQDLPAGAVYAVITSRAFASLADFVTLTAPLLAREGVWLAMKGRRPDDEIAALPRDVEVFHVEPLQVPGLDAQRCLVWMRRKDA